MNWESEAICSYDDQLCNNMICISHEGAPAGLGGTEGCWSQCAKCDRKDERNLALISYGAYYRYDKNGATVVYDRKLRYVKDGEVIREVSV